MLGLEHAASAYLGEDAGKGVHLRQLSLKGVRGLKTSAIAALELPQSQGALVIPAPMVSFSKLQDGDSTLNWAMRIRCAIILMLSSQCDRGWQAAP